MGTASKALTATGYRSNAAVFIASAAMLLGAAVFLFAVTPALVERFRLAAGATDGAAAALKWLLPSAAAGIAFGGAALGLMTIVRLVREMEKNLFAWLAPPVAIFSAVMISGVRFEIPFVSVESAHFAVLSAFLFVGGGAVALVPRWPHKVLGITLGLFPAAVFVLAHTLQQGGVREAWGAADRSVLYVLFMLLGTCAAVLFIAFAVSSSRASLVDRGLSRSSGAKATRSRRRGAVTSQDWQQFEYERAVLLHEQEELEHYKQQASAEVEQQYRQLQAQYAALEAEREEFQRDQDEVVRQLQAAVEQHEQVAGQEQRIRLSDDTKISRALSRRGVNPLLVGAGLLLIAGAAAGAYLGWVKPTLERTATEREQATSKLEKREQAIRALAQKIEAQNAEMEEQQQELESARQAATEAKAEAAEVQAKAEEANQGEGKGAGSAARSKAQARRAAKARRARQVARRKAASSKGATVSRDDDPIAGLSGL
jgi:hypothetical protein